jgi:hypothetical protein
MTAWFLSNLFCTLKYFQYTCGQAIWRKRDSGYLKKSFYKSKEIDKDCTKREMDTFGDLLQI